MTTTGERGAPARPGSERSEGRTLVAVSGGPSSAVTAAILKSQGHEVLGVYFQAVDPKSKANGRFRARCLAEGSLEAAQEVCRKLDIPLHVSHVEDRFRAAVVDDYIHQRLQGRVAVPCLPCNLGVRMEALFRQAEDLDCSRVATGHHAQVFLDASVAGKPVSARLHKAVNPERDQSYFLFGLRQEQLLRLLMPAGGLQDSMIRRLAEEFELPTVSAGNPQEVCFARDPDARSFLSSHIAAALRPPGLVKLRDGTVIGDHPGLHAYEYGEEPKLKLPPSVQERHQVIGFDPATNVVVAGLFVESLTSDALATQATWIRPVNGLRMIECGARLWPTQREEIPCRVIPFENDTLDVIFEQPQAGIYPGVPIVFYQGDEVLGGAWIEGTGGLTHGA